MSLRRLLRPTTLLAAPLLLAAMRCEEPLAPSDAAGHYVLRTIDGQAIPVVIATEPQERTVISVVVDLRDDRTGTVSHVERIDGLDYSSSVPITWDIDGWDGFVAEVECPADGPCTLPPHMVGRVRSGGLELTRYWADGHAWWLERVHASELDE